MQSEQFWKISGISCGRIMQQCDISGGWICSRVNGQAGVHAHRLGGASVDICIYSLYNFLFSLILRLRNSFICTFDGHYGLTFVHEQFFLNLQSVLKIFAQETYLCNYPWFWRGPTWFWRGPIFGVWGGGSPARTIRACSVWSRPWWPHRAQYITLFFISISLYTMLDWNSNRIYLTDVNLTFPFAASELMWYRGGEWYLRVQRGRGQSQGWHPNQGPRKGGKHKISIWIYKYKYPNQGGGIPSSNYFSTLYCIPTCPHRAEACIWNISPIYPMFNNLDELHYICKCNIPSEPGACAGGAGRWGAGAGAGRLLQPRHRPRPRRHPRQVNLGRAMWVQLSGDFTTWTSVGIFWWFCIYQTFLSPQESYRRFFGFSMQHFC